jgi:hypothetical protein
MGNKLPKNKGGRPPKFKTVEELQEKVNAYFKETKREEWTMTGLAIALDIDYQTLINYGNKELFFEPIKKARMKVHNEYEKDLRRKGRSGDIFALKNFGWTDKTEQDVTLNTPEPILELDK